jgi:nickel-dependent lactate racemase
MTTPTAHVAYGDGRIPLSLDPGLAEWHVVRPKDEAALADPHGEFTKACRNPYSSPPLREVVGPDDKVVIVTSDGTRPVPNKVLIPWLLEELNVPTEQVTVLLGNGSHRPNTHDELVEMFGEDVVNRVTILNHDGFDIDKHERMGTASSGAPVLLDKVYVEADKRIVVGFIEPHLFAGFSGGPKGVVPAVASIETIYYLHNYDIISHPNSTWGLMEDNPVQDSIREMVAMCPPEFLLNVTLNNDKGITGFFTGDYREAHAAGCAHVRENAMAPVPKEFPLVITSNSGYPLDQNVYQSVKGMSAAARIVEEGGSVVMASECRDGVPTTAPFYKVLEASPDVAGLDTWLRNLTAPVLDQWQVQTFHKVLGRCKVAFHSGLEPGLIETCKMDPVENFQEHVREAIESIGRGAPVAVLAEGPITIPYVA